MPRKAQNINSLARGRVRASMNKYNLFNLYKKARFLYLGQTLYQQKWMAKQETRAYHGEHLPEGRWKTLFTPSLQSVAQMDATLKGKQVADTPMTLQTYAVLEKRLEFALFRAMFALSIRQARQFILGGHVQVNGVTIKHPSFPLQAGDIFHVNPEKVLLAMGRAKPSLEQAIKVDNKQITVWNKHVAQAIANPKETWELKQAKPKSLNTLIPEKDVEALKQKAINNMKKQQQQITRELILLDIVKTAQGKEQVNDTTFSKFGKNAHKALAVFQKLDNAKHSLLQSALEADADKLVNTRKPDFESDSERHLATEVKQLLGEIRNDTWETLRAQALENHDISSLPYSPDYTKKLKFHDKLNKDAVLEDELVAQVNLPWQQGLFGRQDPTKKYFTPWTPRAFIGAFAILPAHIEINFATCHAVYMRDPIARPGHSEVITPFPEHLHQRAYMYYARKGM